MRILITGGAGFIGSAVVRRLLGSGDDRVLNLDRMTYAANADMAHLAHPRYEFRQLDIRDEGAVAAAIDAFVPDAIMHLAAETHVDRSIDGPRAFLETNVLGTFALLSAATTYWRSRPPERRGSFRFHHVSTDEVFGDLSEEAEPFAEGDPYCPSSPYSASKAAADHLVRAWHRTYGLPTIVSNTSNNYGPWQFPEKLIPLTILNALDGKPLPVYGDGRQVRDWIHVEDHAEALLTVLRYGSIGETYNLGGRSERRNIEVVETICDVLDAVAPRAGGAASHRGLIQFVTDRPGHDRRYAIDCSRAERELGWRAARTFEQGLEDTVLWYLRNRGWCETIRGERYAGQRLGLASIAHEAIGR